MSQNITSRELMISQLEASCPLYCKTLRILIREHKSLRQMQNSVSWRRLEQLHHYLPRRYKDPGQLLLHLRSEICP